MEEIDWSRRHEAAIRDRIVATYYGYTLGLAKRQIKKLSANVDRESMFSAALQGLLGAIDSFDGGIKATFKTFAGHRIRGSMLDALRGDDHLTRTDRKLVKKRIEVASRLAQSLSRVPTAEEIMAEGGWDAEQYRRSLTKQPCNLETAIVHCPPKTPPTKLSIEHSEHFRDFTRGIDMDGQTLLYLYYYKSATMREIGSALGLSESRVSQMHSQLIETFQTLGKERFFA